MLGLSRGRGRYSFPVRARVIEVSSLLAAALALAGEPVLYDKNGRGGHLAALVLDEIRRAPETKLTLPLPSDARLRRICLGFIDAQLQPSASTHGPITPASAAAP